MRARLSPLRLFTLLVLCQWLAAVPVKAMDWPQEVSAPEGKVIVYQPQPETLEGNILTGRAAISLELHGSDEAEFGVIWFRSRIETDRDAGSALIRDVNITDARWSDATVEQVGRLREVLEASVPGAGFEISLERLSASLEQSRTEQRSLLELNTDPPEILFSEELAVLLLYDGEPRFGKIENSRYQRALNSVFAVARDGDNGKLYLSSGTFWYQADDAMGPWQRIDRPPEELARGMPVSDSGSPEKTRSPAIITATKPTELVVTEGKPRWKSLPGGDLLYVVNTETPWIRELDGNRMYLLLSGRWFHATEQGAPWTFIRSDRLPESFSRIPPESDIGGLRVSVANTDEANDALRDAQIPQTAAIRRDTATLTVEYDGKPKFDSIPGTRMRYAVNTTAQVLWVDGRYYAVDDGVWFTAANQDGPWELADSIPEEEIRTIPPESPVYNTTYVRIFDATPEVVYVGYYPGYRWSFPYHGVPVYGTGWYYPPYWGRAYYPRHPTWGFHVGYNPWNGWNFGLSWSRGFVRVGVSWGAGRPATYRPWGCCRASYGYRGPVRINTGDINIGNNINVANRESVSRALGSRNIDPDQLRTNLYAQGANRSRTVDRAAVREQLRKGKVASGRANDLYATRDGAVARHAKDQWEVRRSGSWKPAENIERTRPSGAAPAGNTGARSHTATNRQKAGHASAARGIDRSSLNRAQQARQRGASRERSHAPARRAASRRR